LLARLSDYRPLDFDAGVRNLFAPAGLDIGSEAPEEIALSITSEIAAVLSDRHGGFLRERKSGIHPTNIVAAGGDAA
jgi:xanthine/CO dehydrogenase XdhC/CoxF family maturation factor